MAPWGGDEKLLGGDWNMIEPWFLYFYIVLFFHILEIDILFFIIFPYLGNVIIPMLFRWVETTNQEKVGAEQEKTWDCTKQ